MRTTLSSEKADHLTEKLVQEVQSISEREIPSNVQHAAKQCVLDWFGVAIAGSQEPMVRVLMDAVDADCGHSGCTIVGRTQRTSPSVAALVNGLSGDVLDYSDHNLAMLGHPTACVLPAALAIGEFNGCSGSDFLRSFVVGVETACRVGMMIGNDIMSTSFHPTATFGPFGACAAVGQQLSLDTESWKHAFGITATQTAGLKASAGTMCKPFHAGKAASNGLLAARMAKRGFRGHPAIMENHVGFIASHSFEAASNPLARALTDTHGEFLILGTVTKEYAACRLTHGSIKNMMALRADIRPEQIAGIELHVPPTYLNVCNIASPTTSLEAKFSLRTTAALAMLGYDMGLPDTYRDDALMTPEVISMRDRIVVVGRADIDFDVSIASAILKDGRTFTSEFNIRESDVDLSHRDKRGHLKFRSLVTPVIGAQACKEFEDMIMALDKLGTIAEAVSLLD